MGLNIVINKYFNSTWFASLSSSLCCKWRPSINNLSIWYLFRKRRVPEGWPFWRTCSRYVPGAQLYVSALGSLNKKLRFTASTIIRKCMELSNHGVIRHVHVSLTGATPHFSIRYIDNTNAVSLLAITTTNGEIFNIFHKKIPFYRLSTLPLHTLTNYLQPKLSVTTAIICPILEANYRTFWHVSVQDELERMMQDFFFFSSFSLRSQYNFTTTTLSPI